MKRLLFFICLLLSFIGFSQEKRLALVIGNSAYEHGGVLRNPVNDAIAMKNTLEQLGFEVIEKSNLDQVEMKRAIDDYGLRLKNYDVGLFFYAGHGIQAKGNNYLIPVDANLLSENDVEYNCINAGRVLGKMEDADSKTRIMIFDACRNNPFERSWTRSTSGRGLASMDAPIGSIIAYATAPGTTASDGEGMNGLYTSSLIKHITTPGQSIEDLFKQVRIDVVSQSDGNQTPWESTSLMGDFYFYHDNSYISKVEDNTNQSDLKSSLLTKPMQDSIFHQTALLELLGLKYHYEFQFGLGLYFTLRYRPKFTTILIDTTDEFSEGFNSGFSPHFQTLAGGLSYRIGEYFRPYVGGVLERYQSYWGPETEDFDPIWHIAPGLEIGLLFSINRLVFDIGVFYTESDGIYFALNMGIGYRF